MAGSLEKPYDAIKRYVCRASVSRYSFDDAPLARLRLRLGSGDLLQGTLAGISDEPQSSLPTG